MSRFRDAWEEFQGDFYKEADLDKEHGGAYIITEEGWSRICRAMHAKVAALDPPQIRANSDG